MASALRERWAWCSRALKRTRGARALTQINGDHSARQPQYPGRSRGGGWPAGPSKSWRTSGAIEGRPIVVYIAASSASRPPLVDDAPDGPDRVLGWNARLDVHIRGHRPSRRIRSAYRRLPLAGGDTRI